MRSIALFLFHKEFEVCADRLDLLHYFNAGLKIFGLFGGYHAEADHARRAVASRLEALHIIDNRCATWKWLNTDLAVRAWYKQFGHTIRFDRIYVLQWDLLLLDNLKNLYGAVPEGALGLTGMVALSDISHRWAWSKNYPHRYELERFEGYLRSRFGCNGGLTVCLGPGYCLPRAFLDRYSEEQPPDFPHDEARLPGFARALGFATADTGFYPKWFDSEVETTFNADSAEILDETILREISSPRGRRAFHPYRRVFLHRDRLPNASVSGSLVTPVQRFWTVRAPRTLGE
jgi:hypothetical protein